jgi:hypothetical protein
MTNLLIIETILRNRIFFFDEIRGNIKLRDKIIAMLLSCALFLGIYGAVMGSSASWMQALSSAIKLPILFLITLAICTPSLHFFSILFGSKQNLPQTIGVILTAMTTTGVILVSFAPVTLFFILTTRSYAFLLLLNVLFFVIAGIMGLLFLRQGIQMIGESDNLQGLQTRYWIFQCWIVLYAFVGSQMAFVLSPFVGESTVPFELIRPFGGNFYSYLLEIILRIYGGG